MLTLKIVEGAVLTSTIVGGGNTSVQFRKLSDREMLYILSASLNSCIPVILRVAEQAFEIPSDRLNGLRQEFNRSCEVFFTEALSHLRETPEDVTDILCFNTRIMIGETLSWKTLSSADFRGLFQREAKDCVIQAIEAGVPSWHPSETTLGGGVEASFNKKHRQAAAHRLEKYLKELSSFPLRA